MAYKVLEDYTTNYTTPNENSDTAQRISASGETNAIQLPNSSYVKDADISRDGVDLVLETDNATIIIEGYYSSEIPPNLVAPDGTMLTENLVEAFTNGGNEYANSGLTANDASPIGAIQEISGQAIIIRTDGTEETIGIGTPVYAGDIVETDENGAVNIMFVDETTFAVSEDARLSIDEYVFDPATQSGVSNFSVLKGVFVFTSGLIGRDDPDDVTIDTPSGSIGIRGTIIAGDVDSGEITVIEGAIVLHDYSGNSITLSNQYETARFSPLENNIEHIGQLEAADVSSKFMSISTVAADLFSSIQDSASETGQDNNDSKDANQETKKSEDQQKTQPEQSEELGQTDNNNESGIKGQAEPQQEAEVSPESESDNTQSAQEDEGQKGGLKVNSKEQSKDEVKDTPNEGAEATQSEEPTVAKTSLEAEPQETSSTSVAEIITSAEITKPQQETQTARQELKQEARQTSQPKETSQQSKDVSSEKSSETIVQEAPPPMSISTTAVKVAEGAFGATVFQINGQNTAITNIQLIGTSQNYYEAVRHGDNTLSIKFKDGISADAENIPPLHFRASDQNGEKSIFRQLTPDITNTDEATTFNGTMPGSFFKASENSHFEYNFSQDFSDPEGDITGYQLITSPSHGAISNVTFDATTGVLTFDVGILSAHSSTIPIEVRALSTSGNVGQTYGFHLLNDTTSSPNILSGSQIYSGNAADIFINGSGAYVFADKDAAANHVRINSNSATVKTGEGNDRIDIQFTSVNDFNVYGGHGDELFMMNSTRGKVYGEAGRDRFQIESTDAINHLEAETAGIKLDGGAGHDVIQITIADTIDFSNITNGFIQNIETISTANGATNIVDLSYNDVINMTDDKNVLILDADENDTINFTNSPGHLFVNTGQHTSQGGETYDIYRDGTITLLIDTDATITGVV